MKQSPYAGKKESVYYNFKEELKCKISPMYSEVMVFNDKVMKQRLPKDVYKALKRTMDEQKHLIWMLPTSLQQP